MSLLSCSSFDLYCILSYYYFAMIELIKMDVWMDLIGLRTHVGCGGVSLVAPDIRCWCSGAVLLLRGTVGRTQVVLYNY